MCGIIGLYGDDTNVKPGDKKQFMVEGLVVDSIRGYDSTGLAVLPRAVNGHPLVYKKALAGYEFICLKRTAKLIDEMTWSYGMIAHNRAMTRGDIRDETAHPFSFGNITLVHNGTVTNASTLGKEWNKELTVDSAHVAWALNQYGADEVLPKLEGGYSLVWWDQSDKTLHFARNDMKPMFWAFALKEQMLYFGSEIDMITLLAKRNGLALQEKMYQTTAMNHYIFRNPKKVHKFEKVPYTKKATAVVTYSGRYNTRPPYNPPSNDTWKPSAGASTTTPAPGSSTDMDTTTNGSKEVGVINDGRTGHPIEKEVVSRDQGAVLADHVIDEERAHALHNLGVLTGIPVNRPIIVTPYMWKPYEKEATIGVMYCVYRDIKTSPIQVFNITMGQWNQIAMPMSGRRNIVVDITNYRNMDVYKSKDPKVETAFVARLNAELTRKYQTGHTDSDTEADLGHTKQGYVQIGDSHKRWVSEEHFDKLVGAGCVQCADPISIDDILDITWVGVSDDLPLCYHCGNDETILTRFANEMYG